MLLKYGDKYPLFKGDLLLEHPEWAEGNPLPPGWDQVVATEMPEPVEGFVWIEDAPVIQGTQFVRTWKQVPAPEPVDQVALHRELGFSDYEIAAMFGGI